MRRRFLLAGMGMLGGCSVLPNVPYAERREWPLNVPRPQAVSPASGSPVLLVRTTNAAPGLEQRGLQSLLPDSSVHVDFYEQWAVPPAQGIEAALRQWLTETGLFAAVITPGSRVPPDLVLESELTVLIADPPAHVARASLACVLLDQRRNGSRVLLQRTFSSAKPLIDTQPPAMVAALRAAVADILGQVEIAIRETVR